MPKQHFAVRLILALLRPFAIMASRCSKIIAISVLNAAQDVVETTSAHTPYCVIRSVKIIWIVQPLEAAVVMVIAHSRSYVKVIKLQAIIVINRVNVLPDTVVNRLPQMMTNRLGQIGVRFIRKKCRSRLICGPTFHALLL